MSRQKIPLPVVAVVAGVLSSRYTHAELDRLFEAAGIPDPPPPGVNKTTKSRDMLKRANDAPSVDALHVLGYVLDELMEADRFPPYGDTETIEDQRVKIKKSLAAQGLGYARGGHITKAGQAAISKSLDDIIAQHDFKALEVEFERTLANVETDPGSAVTGSCALLESLFKIYISDEGLPMPSQQTVKPLWSVVQKHLGLDPAALEDDDLRKVLSGLSSVVDGIGSLRTHAGSAHGHGKKSYKLLARHARLTAHAAFTLATFVIETWQERKAKQ